VTGSGRCRTNEEVAAARAAGATDEEIHDRVLIAASFRMVNRYVDGLAANTPSDEASYDRMGRASPRTDTAGQDDLRPSRVPGERLVHDEVLDAARLSGLGPRATLRAQTRGSRAPASTRKAAALTA
jgi:hypothetical protein